MYLGLCPTLVAPRSPTSSEQHSIVGQGMLEHDEALPATTLLAAHSVHTPQTAQQHYALLLAAQQHYALLAAQRQLLARQLLAAQVVPSSHSNSSATAPVPPLNQGRISQQNSVDEPGKTAQKQSNPGTNGQTVTQAGPPKQQKCTNTGKGSFTCQVCNKALATNSNLKAHMRIHTGERPYKCDQCTKTFKHRNGIRSHKISIHSGKEPVQNAPMRTHTGEKSYQCPKCSYAASHQGNLTRHMRIHTNERPYKCDQCSYTARQKVNLQAHKRTHTDERPYPCSHCGYAAKQRNNLVMHMHIHTNERP